MSDVFISYSRKDSAFIKTIFQALEDRKFTAWVDWSDIYKGEKWLEAIYLGIENADTFLFVLSPSSLTSEVCHKEIAHARQHNKRIIPIVFQPVEQDNKLMPEIHTAWFEQDWEANARANWTEIKAINWLYFREADDFQAAMTTLMEALRTDVVRVRQHTQLLNRALQWERNNRNSSILLSGDELAQAEEWLNQSEQAESPPRPTDLLRDYIQTSHADYLRRLRHARRLKQAAAGFAVFAVLAVLITGFALRRASVSEEHRATERWEASIVALREARDGTLTAGLGMVPPTSTHVPDPQFVATTTRVAQLNAWIPEVATFNGVEMVRVPAGCFWMGSASTDDEQPITEICFEDDFWIDRTEVTNEQFERLGGTAVADSITVDAPDLCPANVDPQAPRACITWQEANRFCIEHRGMRLPNEAEWEYAARGPDSLLYPWGNTFDPTKVAYAGNTSQGVDEHGDEITRAQPVGSFDHEGSWVGALDMSGNVLEWVSSHYAPYPYAPDDGRENLADDFALRVMRGGSFLDASEGNLRATFRLNGYPTFSETEVNFFAYVGFRCAQ
ncbi:MAG: hypothetical protein BroJett018_24150 [Chloroflexota bacterium]|nr:MAG: hypothetical protein BroJett018_24150 [Chloroflexota bacterium]